MTVAATDYEAEGAALLRRVNLKLDGAPERYATANPIYEDPDTSARLFVGNASLARDREGLRRLGIARIVFCQDGDGHMPFRDDPEIRYLPFPIGLWRMDPKLSHLVFPWCSSRGAAESDAACLAYFRPLFDFMDEELGAGNSVLIHCLAGAHRAGTAGIACLMHLCDLDAATATAAAQAARPAIEPIGGFPKLIAALNEARASVCEKGAGGGEDCHGASKGEGKDLSGLPGSGARLVMSGHSG